MTNILEADDINLVEDGFKSYASAMIQHLTNLKTNLSTLKANTPPEQFEEMTSLLIDAAADAVTMGPKSHPDFTVFAVLKSRRHGVVADV